ncbi:HET domain-containing protein [Zalerion maritima]|uniref:HET domain-containing protein n=1 Tax=Zalerion maritima TaxID=339359 RepID=A0AAD5RYX2_9PEZI|nr:HET domain-containing protein [Zalerion maritima]
MRLLNTRTLALHEFLVRIPHYVILSHTWEQEEVTFRDIHNLPRAKTKQGFSKIDGCCRIARENDFEWVWIDTCCIDKSDSSELSEAINNMFCWYKNSTVCYVYLSDVEGDFLSPNKSPKTFSDSRWWTRGWTLQELIAPSKIEFYAGDWKEIGTKRSLLSSISKRTGIRATVLKNSETLDLIYVGERMSWASDRQTTKVEDMAYCLLGLFDIQYPLIYGEGPKAFRRLQEEILRKYKHDLSLLVWWSPHPLADRCSGVLAESPLLFKSYKHLGDEVLKVNRTQTDPSWIASLNIYSPRHLQAALQEYERAEPQRGDRQAFRRVLAAMGRENTICHLLFTNKDCRQKFLSMTFAPTRLTLDGLEVTLMTRPADSDPEALVAWTYCTYMSSSDEETMVCLLLRQSDGIYVRDRQKLALSCGTKSFGGFQAHMIPLELDGSRPILYSKSAALRPPGKEVMLLFPVMKPSAVIFAVSEAFPITSREVWIEAEDEPGGKETMAWTLFSSWEKNVGLRIFDVDGGEINFDFVLLLGSLDDLKDMWCALLPNQEALGLCPDDTSFSDRATAQHGNLGIRAAIKTTPKGCLVQITIKDRGGDHSTVEKGLSGHIKTKNIECFDD